jgi:hypothetical protein
MGKGTKVVTHEGTGSGTGIFYKRGYGEGYYSTLSIGYPLPSLDDIASRKLHMPLIEQVHNNRLIWKAEKNGYYLVCSAYRLCVEELVDVSHLRQPGN